MKKSILFFVAFIAIATIAKAQGSVLATLNHNDTIQTFYGASAYQAALDAATHGDVITLSAGQFLAKNIEKAVSIHGAGMGVGENTDAATVIVNDFSINIPNEVTERLEIEGIYHNGNIEISSYKILKNPTFMKCRFKNLYTCYNYYNSGDWHARIVNGTFLHCYIKDLLRVARYSSVSLINCFVGAIDDREYHDGMNSNFDFLNCVLWDMNGSRAQNSTFNNCIIYSTRTDNALYSANNTANNCVIVHDSINVFQNIANTSNTLVNDVEEVFQNFKGTYADNITYELTDAAKQKYKGTDGTEVGMYGGSFPFDPTTSNPRITRCVVAPKSTADGKLSIDIEVSN